MAARFSFPAVLLTTALMVSHSASAADSASASALANIVSLAATRLAQAAPVAQWKWHTKQPIEDPERERFVMDNISQRARATHMDVDYVASFMRDQIEANKAVQEKLFQRWKDKPPPAPAPDTLATARAEIVRLSSSVLPALANLESVRNSPTCPTELREALDNWKRLAPRPQFDDSAELAKAVSHVCTQGPAAARG